ncbi:heme ABC transporter ATP-binding protein [Rhodococcus pyridinivorans]|nr:heme ABC transporter ATP-binding protein [Rhodococcus pyridinivorans]MCD2119328.1 heme ABC transporter ATP-binding protein [Rhodococcus pyridinivorans]MCZ4628265.1 heme ABC transporter ATP-binding protein [Rhodococcus pyridinivorans]MCZ4649526.1 heme ABC transporter ATP-binding protein [Rhodococcus pyridinivorans]MDJ0483111.1 heme ABC transporter ATP-binding protein [Rhodococcus pyridinivorans]MDV7255580.1 heme ABC transporter ATP-binding protein [Rhodococcus pyridinivorans]
MRLLPRSLGTPDAAVPARSAPGTATMRAVAVRLRRGEREILHGVDFEVRTGEVVALVGPNGAGKSTLLAALSGDHPISGGTVEVEGRALERWSSIALARRRAVLPQQHTVGFPFTARQVVRMGRAAWARTPRQGDDDRIVAEAFGTCDVAHLADRPFPALSGGERARVALARVLAQDTETLLLDEPTAALDLGHQEAVMQVVRARADDGHAVVVVLHDLGLAAAYADRVCVLEQGRIVADGAPGDVLTEELLGRVYQYPVAIGRHPETGTPLVLPRRPNRDRSASAQT